MDYEVTINYRESNGDEYTYTDVVNMTRDEANALRERGRRTIDSYDGHEDVTVLSLDVEPVNVLSLASWRSAYGDLLLTEKPS